MRTRVAYLVPEFPGQTHTWIWRELQWLRRWGGTLQLVSTRPPPLRDRARHEFASASRETVYLGTLRPRNLIMSASAMLAILAMRPRRLLAAAGMALHLPIDGGGNWFRCLPLLVPAAGLARLCERQRLELVHCHTCANGAVIAMLSQEMGGPPYSLTINANLEWWGGAMAEKIGGAEFAVSTMRWVIDQAERDYPPEIVDRIDYAPVGVDTETWRPPATRPTLEGRPLKIVCVGRLYPTKGFDDALQATRKLLDDGLSVSLAILGDGPDRERLNLLIAQLGLASHAVLRGSVPQEEVRAAMGAADLFLLPSHAEPLGVVVMEAMSLETPVIATDAGGVAEIVTAGVDGILVPPKNPDALARAVIALVANPEHMKRLGQAGRPSIIAKFDSRIGARTVFRHMFGQDPAIADQTSPRPPDEPRGRNPTAPPTNSQVGRRAPTKPVNRPATKEPAGTGPETLAGQIAGEVATPSARSGPR